MTSILQYPERVIRHLVVAEWQVNDRRGNRQLAFNSVASTVTPSRKLCICVYTGWIYECVYVSMSSDSMNLVWNDNNSIWSDIYRKLYVGIRAQRNKDDVSESVKLEYKRLIFIYTLSCNSKQFRYFSFLINYITGFYF